MIKKNLTILVCDAIIDTLFFIKRIENPMKVWFTSFVLCFLCMPFVHSYAQEQTWRVYMKDKGNEPFVKGSALYKNTLDLHSKKSLERRSKVLHFGNSDFISIEDAPIYKPYIDQITSLPECTILLRLRWRNYIVVRCDSTVASKIETFPFVHKLEKTNKRLIAQSTTLSNFYRFINNSSESTFGTVSLSGNCGTFRYGFSDTQNRMLGIPDLHSLGILGDNSLLAFFDTGFRWKSHASLWNSKVEGEYDFVMLDSITANQEGDRENQDEHGTLVMSTVGGFQQDSLVGVAPNATFYLAKTEDIRSETRMEEENYSAAVEWAESRGVDIISSSLSYGRLDSTDETYSYNEMDGSFPITSRAVNDAVKRGVVCITAAGNSGPRDSTISSPGDADSVITVAGVAPDGVSVIGFSSRGPTASKVLKPDLSAQCVQVVTMKMGDSTAIKFGSGTSFATPLIAGCVALMLSQYPELTPWQIRNSLFRSAEKADTFSHKDIGYGVPKIKKAMLANGPLITRISSYPVGNYMRVITGIVSNTPITSAELIIKFGDEMEENKITLLPTDKKPYYAIDIPLEDFNGKDALAFISVNSGTFKRSFPCNYNGEGIFTPIPFNKEDIRCGISRDSLPTIAVIASVNENNTSMTMEYFNGLLQLDLGDSPYVETIVYDVLGNLIYRKEFSVLSYQKFTFDFTPILPQSGTFYAIIKNGVHVKRIALRH